MSVDFKLCCIEHNEGVEFLSTGVLRNQVFNADNVFGFVLKHQHCSLYVCPDTSDDFYGVPEFDAEFEN